MINAGDLVSGALLLRRVFMGAYQAATAAYKYRLYNALSSASSASTSNKPLSDVEKRLHDFTEFLVKAQIYTTPEDYAGLEAMPEVIYQAYFLGKKGEANITISPQEMARIGNCFQNAKSKYNDFCEAYDKLVSKGYDNKDSIDEVTRSIRRSIYEKKRTRRTETAVVNFDLAAYRSDVLNFFDVASQNIKKSKDEDKESNVEITARTSRIDTDPIVIYFNGKPMPISLKEIQSRSKSKSSALIESLPQAMQALSTSDPMTPENVRMLERRYSLCMAQIGQFEAEKRGGVFYKNIENALVGNTGISQKWPTTTPEMAIHMLAILSIGFCQDEIKEGMTLERIITLGQAEAFKHSFNDLRIKDDETLIQLINTHLSPADAKAVIATFKAITNERKSMNFRAIHTEFMRQVFNIPPSQDAKVMGKPLLETVLEHCEASATKNEYIERMNPVANELEAYITTERLRASTVSELSETPLQPQMVAVSKDREQTSLNAFIANLEERVDKKSENRAGAAKLVGLIKNLKGKEQKIIKKEVTQEFLGEAIGLLKELIAAMMSKHKTPSGNKNEAERSEQINRLNEEISKYNGIINTHYESISSLDAQSKELHDAMAANETEFINFINAMPDKIKSYLGITNTMNSDQIIDRINDKAIESTFGTMIKTAAQGGEKDRTQAKFDIEYMHKLKTQYEVFKRKRDNALTQLQQLDDAHQKLQSEISILIRSTAENNTSLEQLIEASFSYQELPDPIEMVEIICDAISDTRIRTFEPNEQFNPIGNEKDTQNELFTNFYNALIEMGGDGPELAVHMLNYVNGINAKQPKWKITINRTVSPNPADQPPGVSVGSSTSSGSATSSVESLVRDRERLLSTANDLLAEKDKLFSFADKAKMVFLKQAVDFRLGSGTPEDISSLSREIITCQRALKIDDRQMNTPSDNDDRTVKLLKELHQHVRSYNELQPGQKTEYHVSSIIQQRAALLNFANNLSQEKSMLTRNPALHAAKIDFIKKAIDYLENPKNDSADLRLAIQKLQLAANNTDESKSDTLKLCNLLLKHLNAHTELSPENKEKYSASATTASQHTTAPSRK